MTKLVTILEEDEAPRMLSPDRVTARRYGLALTGEENPVLRFRLFYERHKNSAHEEWKIEREKYKPVELVGTLTALWPQIKALQKQGYGAFVVVNQGDCDGEFISDTYINAIRANFIDRDGTPRPKQFHLEPDFIVRRDADHDQFYWLARSGDVNGFKRMQLRLAAYYGTDTAVCNPSRVMRLPGSLHLKDDAPIFVTFEENPNRLTDLTGPYTADQVADGLPEISIADCQARAAESGEKFDTPSAVSKFQRYLQDLFIEGKFAVWGDNGNAFTFEVIAKGKDWGVSPAMILEIVLTSAWNKGCSPPWDEDELTILIANVFNYGENDPGCDAPKHVYEGMSSEAFEKLRIESMDQPDPAPTALDEPKPRGLRFYNTTQLLQLPSPRYRVKPWLTTNSDALLYAPKNHAKTFVGLDFCCSIAANIAALGGQYEVCAPGPAFYCLLEGGDSAKLRVIVWCLEHGIKPEDLPLYILTTGPIVSRDAVETLIAAIKAHLKPGEVPAIIGFDTLGRVLSGLDQNDAGVASGFTNYRSDLRAAFPGLTTLTVHHTPVGEPGRPRGAGGFADDADTVLQLSNARKAANIIHVRLTAEHQRFGAAGQTADLAAIEISIPETYGRDDTGNLFTSLVIRADRAPLPDAKGKRAKNEGGISRTELEGALMEARAYPGGDFHADAARKTGGINTENLADVMVRRRLRRRQIESEPTADELRRMKEDLRKAATECRDLVAYGLPPRKGGNFWSLKEPLSEIEGEQI